MTTTFTSDDAGNQLSVTHPDGGTANYDYFANGLLESQSGEGLNTVEYTYDDFGRNLKTMVTHYGSAGTAATTQWEYDSHRGWLDRKSQVDHGAIYDYTAAGRLSKRTWDRGDVADY